MAENSFVYDPSGNIKESFKDITTNIGTAFTNIIAQKQQDLALADKVFQNLDTIKEETAAIGSARINQKIKQLTQDAPDAMFKDGKLDFDGMGKVMGGVSEIKGLKNWWGNVAEIKKQYMQLATATAKDMTSLSSFFSQIDPMIAENEGGNLEDFKKKLAKLYDNHLDYNTMAREKLLSAMPLDKLSGEIMDGQGNLIGYSTEAPKGMVFDPATKKVVMPGPSEVLDPITQKPIIDTKTGKPVMETYIEKAKKALGPEFIAKFKEHLGVSPKLVTDDAIAMQVVNSFSAQPQFKTIKTKEGIQMEKDQAKILSVEARDAEKLSKLKIQKINLEIKEANARIKALEAKASSYGNPKIPKNVVVPVIRKDAQGNPFIVLTKGVETTVTGANFKAKDGGIVKGAVNPDGSPAKMVIDRIYNSQGKTWARGVVTDADGVTSVRNIVLSVNDTKEFLGKLGGQEPAHRYSNAYGLSLFGFKEIPASYLALPQDTEPDDEQEDVL